MFNVLSSINVFYFKYIELKMMKLILIKIIIKKYILN